MEKNTIPDIEKYILEMLKRKKKDYLTVTQLRNSFSAVVLRELGITKTKVRGTEILKRIKPYLGRDIEEFKGARTSYIGYNMTLKDIILDKVKRNPGISSKNLAKNMPMTKKIFIATLNKLLESGDVICTFNESHTPRLKLSSKIGEQTSIEESPLLAGRAAFKEAYNEIGKGRGFVRIHRIREYLDWSREHFDNTLMELMGDYTIELHGGDPSIMTEQEIKDSYTDENGLLYINLTWWGENDE
jgi:hypothetical protein